MARFLAIHNVSGFTEEQFREKLSTVSKWRPDRRTTILKVYGDSERGKLVTECEAVEQEHFEDWICLLYTSPRPRDRGCSRMPSSA